MKVANKDTKDVKMVSLKDTVVAWQECYVVSHRGKKYIFVKFYHPETSIAMIEDKCANLGYTAQMVVGFINHLSGAFIEDNYPFLKNAVDVINNFSSVVVKSEDSQPGHSTLRKRFCYCLVEVTPFRKT